MGALPVERENPTQQAAAESARPSDARGAALWSTQQFENAPKPPPLLKGIHASLLDLFVVKSSSGSSLAYLDGIRAVAVILVVLFHCWILAGTPMVVQTVPSTAFAIHYEKFFATGYFGVDLFFVLSGFLLSQYWLKADFESKPRPDTRRFYRHRFFRILPAYYCCVIFMVLFLTPFLIPTDFVYSITGLFLLSSHLLFVHYLFPLSSASYSINGALWTLTIEMIFYLILPWFVLLFLRNRWMVTLPILAAVTVGWLYLAKNSLGPVVHLMQQSVAKYAVPEDRMRDLLAQQFPGHLVKFGLGMTLANIFVRSRSAMQPGRLLRIVTNGWMGKLYFITGWVVVGYSMIRVGKASDDLSYYFISRILVAIGFTLILAGLLFGGNVLQAIFGITPLRLIGIVGFSAYLWHMPITYLILKYPAIAALAPQQRFPSVVWHTALLLGVISCLMYLLVEKPFLLIGRQRVAVGGNLANRTREPLLPSPARVAEPAPASVGAGSAD